LSFFQAFFFFAQLSNGEVFHLCSLLLSPYFFLTFSVVLFLALVFFLPFFPNSVSFRVANVTLFFFNKLVEQVLPLHLLEFSLFPNFLDLDKTLFCLLLRISLSRSPDHPKPFSCTSSRVQLKPIPC